MKAGSSLTRQLAAPPSRNRPTRAAAGALDASPAKAHDCLERALAPLRALLQKPGEVGGAYLLRQRAPDLLDLVDVRDRIHQLHMLGFDVLEP